MSLGTMPLGRYGDAWETYPVRPGETWTAGEYRFLCQDVTQVGKSIDAFLPGPVDVIYTDPPWNPGNLRYFYTLSGEPDVPDYLSFLEALAIIFKDVCPWGRIILDMGTKSFPKFQAIMEKWGGHLLGSEMTTYGNLRRPLTMSVWTFGGETEPVEIPTALHGYGEIAWVIREFVKKGDRFFDPCAGSLVYSILAARQGAQTFGIELIPRKLAAGLKSYAGDGYQVKRETA